MKKRDGKVNRGIFEKENERKKGKSLTAMTMQSLVLYRYLVDRGD